MKTAIYIEDGVVQLVLTPESDFEKNALSSFEGKPTETKIVTGSFYDCQGGFTRQRQTFDTGAYPDRQDRSLILRVTT